MNLDAISLPFVFLGCIVLVLCTAEAGYRLGLSVLRKSEAEKESPVSAIGAAVLGLTGFMLAFAFGIATERFDMRKALVREEAVAIRTAYSRSDFLPDSDRVVAKGLLRAYVVQRVTAVRGLDAAEVHRAIDEAVRIQRRLWDMAVVNARRDMNSDVAALYIESLNEVAGIHATRVAVAWQARIPAGVWQVLCLLVGLGMLALGYQAAIAGSGRTWASLLLAISFSVVISLIVSLDRPQGTFIRVTQQPLQDVRNWMDDAGRPADTKAGGGGPEVR